MHIVVRYKVEVEVDRTFLLAAEETVGVGASMAERKMTMACVPPAGLVYRYKMKNASITTPPHL